MCHIGRSVFRDHMLALMFCLPGENILSKRTQIWLFRNHTIYLGRQCSESTIQAAIWKSYPNNVPEKNLQNVAPELHETSLKLQIVFGGHWRIGTALWLVVQVLFWRLIAYWILPKSYIFSLKAGLLRGLDLAVAKTFNWMIILKYITISTVIYVEHVWCHHRSIWM